MANNLISDANFAALNGLLNYDPTAIAAQYPNYQQTPYDQYTLGGLANAQQLIQNQTYNPYPEFVPSQTTAPTQSDYVNYTPLNPLSQVSAPNYKISAGDAPTFQSVNTTANTGTAPTFQYTNPNVSLGAAPTFQSINTDVGWNNWTFNPYSASAPTYNQLNAGDYEALQKALATPGEIAARQAYEQGQINLINQMGGNGLYGSSIMANQARNALEQPYMDTLATNAANAAAKRYELQQADLSNMSAQELQAWLAKLQESTTGQSLMASQNIAQNESAQSNANRALQQSLAANQFAQTGYGQQLTAAQENANRALQQSLAANQFAQTGYGQQLTSAQENANRALQQSLAGNTFAQTGYGQQVNREQDYNQFMANLYPNLLEQAKNQWTAGVTSTQDQRAYELAKLQYDNEFKNKLTDWQNQQALEGYNYQLANRADQQAWNEGLLNQYLALSGQGAPLQSAANAATNAQNQYLASIQNTNTAARAVNTAGWLGAAGTLGAGLLSNPYTSEAIGTGISSGIDWLSGLFG